MATLGADRAAIAHVLRRVTFGPFPGQVDRFAGQTVGEVINWAVSAEPLAPRPAAEPRKDDNSNIVADGLLDNLRSPQAGLHEKLAWFWHSHFTTSADKVGQQRLLWRQQKLLRAHALGNFRDLVRAITTDAAMLTYLDGDGSTIEAPNENYGRELMELFTLGRGAYNETDVRSAARALAGWRVDQQKDWAVSYEANGTLMPYLELFGGRGRYGVDELVDAVCAHEACAPFVAGKLYGYFVGTPPTDARRRDLAERFRAGRLEIRPLMDHILRSEDFLAARHARPRYPIEWWCAALSVVGLPNAKKKVNNSELESLGQVPYRPPNVAGWPGGPRLVSAGQMLNRAALLSNWEIDTSPLERGDPIEGILSRCSLYEVGQTTRHALEEVALHHNSGNWARRLFVLALCSPEFSLA